MTFRDILTPKFKNRIKVLTDDANDWLRDLGKNDIIHSKNIERRLDKLVPNEIKNNKNIFNVTEIFFLLYAIYLHDIGRKFGDEYHEKRTYDEIKNSFQKFKLNNIYEAEAVAEICYGHAEESERSIKDITPAYELDGYETSNLQFLAALLRLADEIDNTYRRVENVESQKGKIRNLIRDIHIDPYQWVIKILPSTDIDMKDFLELKTLKESIQRRLDEIIDILEPKGLLYC